MGNKNNECRGLTRKSFATRWQISESYVNKLVGEGVLPVIKIGRRCVRIPGAEGDAALMQFNRDGKGVQIEHS